MNISATRVLVEPYAIQMRAFRTKVITQRRAICSLNIGLCDMQQLDAYGFAL